MKAWTTAEIAGRCAYDGLHTWRPGARVFVLQGADWRKVFCNSCGLARHGAPPDTGEVLDVTDAPSFPKPLKDLADQARSSLFAEAFEEEKPLPFDGRAAAAGEDRD